MGLKVGLQALRICGRIGRSIRGQPGRQTIEGGDQGGPRSLLLGHAVASGLRRHEGKQRKKQGEQGAHGRSAHAHNSHGTKSAPWLGVDRRDARLDQSEAARSSVVALSDRRPIAGSSRRTGPSSAARLNSANRWPGSGLAPVRQRCGCRQSTPIAAATHTDVPATPRREAACWLARMSASEMTGEPRNVLCGRR